MPILSIYGAADLNDDGYLQYKEFELLMRFLSQIPFTETKAKRIFDEYAETFLSEEDEEVKAMSFENLCQLNLDHKIFASNSVKIVTGIKNREEAIAALIKIEENIQEIIEEIHWRFAESQIWEEHIDELQLLLNVIKEKIFTGKNPEKTYLAYCLLDLESKRIIVDERVKEMLPQFALGL